MRRTLSPSSLNRALLARQQLLVRSRRPLVRTVERIGGLQAQYAPSMYVGLWTRVEGFRRRALDRALVQRKVLQGTLMRSTIHLVSAADYPLFALAIREARRSWWLRASTLPGLGPETYAAAADVVASALADGPKPRKLLVETLTGRGFPADVWNGVGLWVDLVRCPPSGTWDRRRADLYGLAGTTTPAHGPAGITPSVGEPAGTTAAQRHLLKRYLAAFGPATMAAASSWAGVPRATLERAASDLDLRTFADETGAELIDLPRLPIPDPDTPAPVRFLPWWDATLLVHARSSAILPEAYRPLVFTTENPASVGTFTVNGAVAGTWRLHDERIVTEAFDGVPRAARRELADEASRLEAWFRTGD